MTDTLFAMSITLSAVATGLVAGVFLTFSDFIMRSLHAASAAAGIEAMQEINRKVYRSIFMVLLLGMVPVSVAISAYAYTALAGPASVWLTAGGLFYIVGVFLVTVFFNVPMNKKLDAMNAKEAGTATYWSKYASVWTRWNHMRSIASACAAACFIIGANLLMYMPEIS